MLSRILFACLVLGTLGMAAISEARSAATTRTQANARTIVSTDTPPRLLKEDGFFLLQEITDKILLNPTYSGVLRSNASTRSPAQ